MSAYNLVNGVHCAENEYLLTDILQEGVRLQGICGLGLGQHLLDGPDGERGDGSGDAGRTADEELGSRCPHTQAAGNGAGWLTADKVLAEVKAGNITEATLERQRGPHSARDLCERTSSTTRMWAAAKWTRRSSRRWRGKGATEGIVLLEERRRICCRWIQRRFIRSR